jgi:hypothetical protein
MQVVYERGEQGKKTILILAPCTSGTKRRTLIMVDVVHFPSEILPFLVIL